jgi:uncharacterized repeat protein (TIGR03943 family)
MLSLIGIVATLWLGATGKLELYIHPRYVPFTTIMTLIAAAFAVAGFFLVPPAHHEHDEHQVTTPRGRFRAAGSLVTVAAAVIGMLMLPPSTLSSTTARQRDLNGSGTLSKVQTGQLVGQDDSAFTVREWASLLRYAPGENYFAGRTATVTGFVTADKADPANIFFVTRFFVTCCVVDAQPVGVPVHDPGWQKRYKSDTWVTVSGGFRKNPGQDGTATLVLIPDKIDPTTQPARPYVY